MFVSVLAPVVMAGVSALVTGMMTAASADAESLYSVQNAERLIAVLTSLILTTYVFGLILKITDKNAPSLRWREWLLIILVFVISYTSLILIHITLVNTPPYDDGVMFLFLAEAGLIALNVVCFYLTNALSRSNSEVIVMKAHQQQQEYNEQYVESIKRQYEETRRLRHDMKQSMAVLYALNTAGKYDEERELLSQYNSRLSSLEVLTDAGSDVINAILNCKISSAREHGIEIICSCSKNISGTDENDLCILLGNMLDNAIEGCDRSGLSHKTIVCSIADDSLKQVITVENSIKDSVLMQNSELHTTKSDRQFHGFGVKTIKATAKKYNGDYDFYEENGMFICRVILYK